MKIVVNKYTVCMYDANNKLKRIDRTIAISEEEAIKKLMNDNAWYYEGTGYDYKKLLYPVTFLATLANND